MLHGTILARIGGLTEISPAGDLCKASLGNCLRLRDVYPQTLPSEKGPLVMDGLALISTLLLAALSLGVGFAIWEKHRAERRLERAIAKGRLSRVRGGNRAR